MQSSSASLPGPALPQRFDEVTRILELDIGANTGFSRERELEIGLHVLIRDNDGDPFIKAPPVLAHSFHESFEKLLGLVGVIDAQHEIFGGYRNGFEIYRNTSSPVLRNDAPLL